MSEPTGLRSLCDELDAAPVNPEVTQLCCYLRDWSVDLLMDQRERVADLLESLVQPEPPTDKEVAAQKNDAECAEAEHCDLLARPEPQGPTDAELITMWATTRYIDQPEGGLAYGRAVLSRWGRPATTGEQQ